MIFNKLILVLISLNVCNLKWCKNYRTKLRMNYKLIFCWYWPWPSFLYFVLALADFHIYVMHYSSWDQPQPIYLYWQIHCCLFPSTRPHEDNTCSNNGILFLWEGRSQCSRGSRDGYSCVWNDMVWECLIKAWWKRAFESHSPHQQNRKPIVSLSQHSLFCGGFIYKSWEHKMVGDYL